MHLQSQNLTQLMGGLSSKKVFRKCEKKSNKIIIDFSSDEKNFDSFLVVYKILKRVDICIPKIYEVHIRKKLIVMEDFGDNSFHNIYSEKKLHNLLKLAVDNLIIIQNSLIFEDIKKLKKYTFKDLKEEISEFVNYYIPYKNIINFLEDDFYTIWKKNFNTYDFSFDSFTHKDFEFINLIHIDKNISNYKCGIIDFQSAFIGFKGWDLFSILENPRINFNRKYNEDLIKYFYDKINIKTDFNLFRNQYYLLNLARHTRLLGRWIKLTNEGNKKYLNYIHPTIKNINSSLENIEDKKLKKIYKNIL